jgi:hypothetical protein
MENDFEKKLIGYLASVGAINLKLSQAQQMKLREWIVPYLKTELELGGGPLNIGEVRKYIDNWEREGLGKDSHKHYYVEKNSNGKILFWDFDLLTWIPVGIGVLFLLWYLVK